MNIPFFPLLFKKKNKMLGAIDSILVKKLKNLSLQSNLLIHANVKIYHHKNSYDVPLILFDPARGLYIFEIKEWTFDDLKNSNIQKADNQSSSNNTLAFDNTQSIMRKKFNELTHNDGAPIFNYLLMENLNADEYEHLNDSFKELLPKEKIIFSDSLQADIFKKLQDASPECENIGAPDYILGTLLVQYAILNANNDVFLCTRQQINFIDRELSSINVLNAIHGSGKSSTILLKAIVEFLTHSSKKIIIIKPTILSCDILKKKLLDIIEHAIIEIDLSAIEILTPLELLNKHQMKLGKDPLNAINIDEKLMKNSFNVANLIICDDSQLFETDFTEYLKHIQKNDKLLLVTTIPSPSNSESEFNKNFRAEKISVAFHKTNQHAKALRIVSNLIAENKENIVVISNTQSREKLIYDLTSFIGTQAKSLDSSNHLINQDSANLILCTYGDINEISAKHVILLDLCFTNENEIEYALNLATKSVNVLYEEDCQEIETLRSSYESRDE